MRKRKTRVCEISVRLVKGVCVECYSGEEQSSKFRLDKYGLKYLHTCLGKYCTKDKILK